MQNTLRRATCFRRRLQFKYDCKVTCFSRPERSLNMRYSSTRPSTSTSEASSRRGSFEPRETFGVNPFLLGGGLSVLFGLSFFLATLINPRSSRHHSGPSDTRSTTPIDNLSSPQYDLSRPNLIAARKEFEDLLGRDGVSDHLGTRIAHSSTEW